MSKSWYNYCGQACQAGEEIVHPYFWTFVNLYTQPLIRPSIGEKKI